MVRRYVEHAGTHLVGQLLEPVPIDLSGGVQRDVVEEHDDEVVQLRAERLMHQVHERGGRVGETEGKHEELEVTVACTKRRLRYVLLNDADLMITRTQIDLTKIFRTLKPIE